MFFLNKFFCFFLYIRFHFLESFYLLFSFSFFLVFLLHTHIHSFPTYQLFCFFSTHESQSWSSPPLLFFCAYLFVFIFFPLRLTSRTQPIMIFWLLLYVCIFVFYFLSSSSHFTHTHSRQRERELAFVYLCFLMRREFFLMRSERESKEEREKNYFLFNQVIILIDKIFWRCYSKSYSVVYFKRGTLATPFQNI